MRLPIVLFTLINIYNRLKMVNILGNHEIYRMLHQISQPLYMIINKYSIGPECSMITLRK